MFGWLTSGIEFFGNIISFLVSSVEVFISDLITLQPFFDWLMDLFLIIPSPITDFIMLSVALTFLVSLFLSFAKS